MDERIIPSAVGDIHVPKKGSNLPIETSIEFTPQNPFTVDIPSNNGESEGVGYPGFPVSENKPSFIKTAVNEFEELGSIPHLLHAGKAPLTEPVGILGQTFYPEVNNKFYHPAPPGWNPKVEIQKLSDEIDPRFIPKLLDTKNPDDFNFTLSSIVEEHKRTEELQNGSTTAKILGGIVGLTLGSIENLIPVTLGATMAKVGSGFLAGAFRSIPGVLPAAAIHEGAVQMDKIDKNLPDFFKDTFIDTVFGVTLFGAFGAGKTLLNVSELNTLKKFSREFIDGVGFNFKVNKKGNLVGFEAVDTTGGSLSAAKVSRAQELADSAFYKGGLYKVPFVGQATADVLTGNIGNLPVIKNVPFLKNSFNYIFGSPLVQLKTAHDYPEASAFADAALDHFITTQGEVKGIPRPKSFEYKVKQTRAMLTDLKMQTDALRAEMNGYKITARPTLGIQNAWSAVKQKSIKQFYEESNKANYYNHDDFMDLVQTVMRTKTSSEHAAVNKAAAMYRKVYDDTAHAYLEAHNLPKDYFRNMETYLSRVFDTKYMNSNEGVASSSKNSDEFNPKGWIPIISNYLREADEIISSKMQPINDLKKQIKDFKSAHEQAFKELGIRELQMHPSRDISYPQKQGSSIRSYIEKPIKYSKKRRGPERRVEGIRETKLIPYEDIYDQYSIMKNQLKKMKDDLQNELRNNPDLDYHIEDRLALSADESRELKKLLTPSNKIKKQIEDQKSIISKIKQKKSSELESAQKSETVEQAKPKSQKYVESQEEVSVEEEKLNELNRSLEDEQYRLYSMAINNEVNPRLYNPLTHQYKDPKDTLKFRKVFNSHQERETTAKAYYNSIMNMHPEDVVNDMFNMMTGNPVSNPILRRTMPIPDEVLYNNNFMTKDLYAKTVNYVNLLSKRTHLKTSFNHVTINGDFEELAQGIGIRYDSYRQVINNRIEKLHQSKENKTGKELKDINKKISKEEKNLDKAAVRFNEVKTLMKRVFETRMMGINKRQEFDSMARRSWMALSSAASLHNLPATQITDFVGWNAYQHGIWPTVRDGIYPLIESLGGILKTKDSEALREMAPHINLGMQDMLNNYADRNWNSELQPDINMGKIVSGIEKYAHFSALTDLTPYIDNGVQRLNGSIIQGNFMRLLHKQVEGTLKPKDALYLVKYGIDPKLWGPRMVEAYTNAGGFKTKVGGYMSLSWKWQDMEAANVFNDAVFRGIQNTIVFKGMGDSPFFADNILGLFAHTFTGWMYAATNRYLIPSLQHADGELLLKMVWMLGVGSLVSPMRRISRGEDAWPDEMTPLQISYEAYQDSGVTSTLAKVLSIANFMSNDKLLGDLKNDKYKNRVKTGIFGIGDVVSSTATRISDVIGMANSGLNEKDLKTAAHMSVISGSMYGHYIGDKIIESWGLPRNKRAAEAENG